MSRLLLLLFSGLLAIGAWKIKEEPDCPPEGIHFIPLPNCSLYLICAAGEGVTMTCPEDLYFNPDNHECDFAVNVPECQGGTRPPDTTPTPEPTIPTDDPSTTTTEGSTEPSEDPSTTSSPSETTTLGTDPTLPSTTESPPDNILRECGEIAIGNSGVIEYRLGENYEPNLRCSFIIRTLNHSGFIFTLEENGLVEDALVTGGPIQIFSFAKEGLMDHANLGPPNPLNQAYVTGSLVLIIFRSNRITGQGFRLKFEATGSWRYDFASYDDMILADPPGSVTYPIFGGEYDYNMLSLFVLSHGHHQIIDVTQTLLLSVHDVIIEMCIDGCTCDFLDIFVFTGSSLQPLERTCGMPTENILLDTQGVFVLLFKSDHNVNGFGFQFEFDLV